jgi:predicted permease
MLRHARERVSALWNRRRRERELADELRFHLSEDMDERVVHGLDAEAARRAARHDLGNPAAIREAVRDEWGWAWAERILQDVRYAVRSLRRSPGFSLVALVTLGLGIGANTAIFSLVNGILLRPLPYPEPDRLVSVTGTYPKGAFVELRASVSRLDVAAYVDGQGMNLSGLGEPFRVTTALVSSGLLSTLGVRPALGRTFRDGEDAAGRDAYAILSHVLWEQRFGRDPAIVGRSIVVDGLDREIVGVMPPEFRFPSSSTQMWVPLHIDPRNQSSYWAGDFMPVVGRLRSGVTIDAAREEVRRFQGRAPTLFPWPMPASWNADVSVVPLQAAVVGQTRDRLLLLLAAVALVLMIACANVANLSLARAATRSKEIAVRCALGAGHSRIARQLLTESIVLALVGAALGLAVAIPAAALLRSILPADLPRMDDVQMEWRVLVFTAAVALATGLTFGLAPALQATRTSITEAVRGGGRGDDAFVRQRLRNALVVAEIALAVLLATAAGLFIRSFSALLSVDAGFRTERVITARITPSPGFCQQAPRCLAFYREVLDKVRSSEGVRGAALVNTLPLDGRIAKRSLNLEGRSILAADSPLVWLNVVTPEYFRVVDISVVSGRTFTEADLSGHPPVALLSRATARRFWTEEQAIGRRIRFVGEEHWHTIVGIVGDVRAYDLRNDVPGWIDGTVYVPYSPKATLEGGRIPEEMSIAVLAAADMPDVGTMVRETVSSVGGDVPVSEVRPLRAAVAEAVASPASVTTLLTAFAVLALALGMIGIYGVLSFLVSRRTREIGIRMALGARRGDVFKSMMKEGLQLALLGVGIGMAAALIVMRVVSRELFGVGPADPATYVVVAGLMLAATLAACCVPTYRATRVDAQIALRQE